ncbi:MAG: nucleotidyl transferase AbiEii/AbiGii toxin family protein [Bacteroidota bacterium]|nr:nucleotidyl transferase AbiEii/AbiGii toxin family protein [Bacteroidota bacterium]
MIKQKEIAEIANKKHVPKTTIDKDWVLGHFLNAMFSFPDVCENFVFKGGTCLHKCYIRDYRFSEDLDFTLIDDGFVINKRFLNKVIKMASKASGIRFNLASLKQQQHENISQGYKVDIKFWGADHSPNQRPLPSSRWQTSIKLDISFSESLILPVVAKKIMHPYSDADQICRKAICYDFRELLSEKIRALKQRNRPRDIYDVWYLRTMLYADSYRGLTDLLFKKSVLKNLTIEGLMDFVNKEKYIRNKRAWSQSLTHQIPASNLPDFDTVYKELTEYLKKIII